MSTIPASSRRDLVESWQAILGRLQLDLNPLNFNGLARETRPLRMEGNAIVVEARSTIARDWLDRQLGVVIRRAICHVLGDDADVEFVAPGERPAPALPEESEPVNARAGKILGSLNCAFSFEQYVAGEGNRLALDCCMALLDPEQARISPVVIFGAPGLGKTHLLHAVACRAAGTGWPVACLSAEEFTTRYQNAIRTNTAGEFKEAIRAVRLLAIDDLQYLAGKKGTQDELVHTIDAVTNAGGVAVVASEAHPFDIGLPERLASRLAGGIVTRVEPFMGAERRAYVDHLARALRISLPAWAIERIAGAEVPSVRLLQGAVHAAVALQRCNRLDVQRLDAELTRLTVAEWSRRGKGDLVAIEAVARYFEVTLDDIAGRSKKPVMTAARAAAAAALKGRGRSLADIGALLGKRDRSTVSDLAERGRAIIEEDAELRALLAS